MRLTNLIYYSLLNYVESYSSMIKSLTGRGIICYLTINTNLNMESTYKCCYKSQQCSQFMGPDQA